MKLAFASDHIGFVLKSLLIKYLISKNYKIIDFGCENIGRVAYPDYAIKVSQAIITNQCERGILICGTGVGMAISANKIPGIRAVVCSDVYTAILSRQHNNANVLALGSRVLGEELAKMIIDSWLTSQYKGGRHDNYIAKITAIENMESVIW